MSDRVLPSGQQWAFRAGEYSGTVVSVGGGLRGLSYGGREVLVGYDEDESAHAGIGQHMFPWPNRIADGQYSFGGEQRQLSLTEPARQNAIHGLTRLTGSGWMTGRTRRSWWSLIGCTASPGIRTSLI